MAEPLTPWNDAVVCASCDRKLLPLSYLIPPHDDPRGPERPNLKCPSCGQQYRWRGSAGWAPVNPEG
jgi:predicted RNA-binding Zn-ribbon protein involved in translation (DUF1610 family)